MLKVYGCFVTQHDWRLVALAAVVCALASLTAIHLLHHVGRSDGPVRRAWLTVAAVATGFGIWATHFIGMMAYQPGLPSGYDISLTVISLLVAVAVTWLGLAVTARPGARAGHWLGGAVVGAGIAAMHYTGMAAFETAGRIVWDGMLIAASLAFGVLFGAAAIAVGLRQRLLAWKALGALLLTLAICSHHFTAMGAATIVPDPMVQLSTTAFPSAWLALGVAAVSAMIIFLSLAALVVDLRDRRRTAAELRRMRDLADAAVEGLVVCNGEAIVAANRSFRTLACGDATLDPALTLADFFPQALDQDGHLLALDRVREAELRAADGQSIPVELIAQEVVYAGSPHRVIAVRDLRDRKKAEKDIHFLAHHDPLTSLPNRASFNKKLDLELAAHLVSGRSLAVLFLDLDRFKEINDLFGHLSGDVVLQFVARQITAMLAAGQVAARLGGDEFAVIAPNLATPAEAERVAQAMIQAVQQPDDCLPAGASVATSVGIAVFPRDAADRGTLLSHADAALYQAKLEGRGVHCFFDAAIGAQLRERRLLEHDLRHAIARGELSLVYQAQARVDTQQVFGFEALLRWNHSTFGAISPSTFIPLAEECGVILQLGEWVLRSACAEAASWTKPLTVAVNVSTVQLYSGDLPRLVDAVLQQSRLAPERLELEITETALVKDLDRALAALKRLKSLGVKIAMDDFGTGYSSLSNLRAFPFDKIKIDGSFVRSVHTNAQAAAIVRAVVGLGRGLNLPVLAEGVETVEELRFLRLEHCDEAQGFLIGLPQPMADVRHLTGTAPAEPTPSHGWIQRAAGGGLLVTVG